MVRQVRFVPPLPEHGAIYRLEQLVEDDSEADDRFIQAALQATAGLADADWLDEMDR